MRRLSTWLRCRLAVALALAPALAPAPLQAAPAAQESELQAVFVINFLRLTEWPAGTWTQAGAPLVLCVDAAREPLLAALRHTGVDMVRGRPLQLRPLRRHEGTRECQALFLDTFEPQRVGAGQLSIGDAPGFAVAGGVIGLVRLDNRLRFEVNQEAAQRAQLRLGSELLKLALPPDSTRRP
ncbi:YfiR family protein [Azohydromonas aeria]|uniref:YfiR family protein n=1 Tax=Azohydromonas aeria TaxID=2590212 RepID=UPI0012FBBAD1|nr:YfiR family protein [Azohydromonas aeria]